MEQDPPNECPDPESDSTAQNRRHLEERVRAAGASRDTGSVRLVETHKYRDEIIELLAAGWTPRSLNQMLGRMFSDYEPVQPRTLNRYRRDCIKADQMRPLEEYERRLRDEHVLLDPIRLLAAEIIVQQGRVQKALDLEKQLGGVVLPAVGAEIDRLARLADEYQVALERLGIMKRQEPEFAASPTASQTVNVYQVLADQVSILAPEDRQQLADLLDRVRLARAQARIAEVDARVQASLPKPEGNGTGEGPPEGK